MHARACVCVCVCVCVFVDAGLQLNCTKNPEICKRISIGNTAEIYLVFGIKTIDRRTLDTSRVIASSKDDSKVSSLLF